MPWLIENSDPHSIIHWCDSIFGIIFHCRSERTVWLPIRRTAKQSPCVTNFSHRAINQNIKIWKKREKKNDKRLRLVAIGVWQTDSIIAHRSYSYSSSKPATDLCLHPNEFDFDFDFIARANYFWFATGSKLIPRNQTKIHFDFSFVSSLCEQHETRSVPFMWNRKQIHANKGWRIEGA